MRSRSLKVNVLLVFGMKTLSWDIRLWRRYIFEVGGALETSLRLRNNRRNKQRIRVFLVVTVDLCLLLGYLAHLKI